MDFFLLSLRLSLKWVLNNSQFRETAWIRDLLQSTDRHRRNCGMKRNSLSWKNQSNLDPKPSALTSRLEMVNQISTAFLALVKDVRIG